MADQQQRRHRRIVGLLLVALAVFPEADSFLLPSFGPKNNLLVKKNPQQKKQKSSPPKQRRKRQQQEDAALKDSLAFNDLLNNANAVLTGVGAGIGAWTALSGPLQKKKPQNAPKKNPKLGSNAWQNMAASFALLATGASNEVTAVPLWMAASAAGILATQQKDGMDIVAADATETEEPLAWVSPPKEETVAFDQPQETVQNEPIWVENELGLIQDQAAHLLDDVTMAVDRLYEQAAIASEEFTGGGGGSRFNGSSSYYSTGYAAGAAKPLYFSRSSSLGTDKPSPDAVSDFVTNLDAAVSSLQEYTPEPYLVSSATLPSIPESGTPPFQQNQYSPTSIGWKENGSSAASSSGYMVNYLDEINEGDAVMANPSYAAAAPLPPNGQVAAEAPKMSTVPGQQAGRNKDGSYAPIQSKNVKGVASSVALAQAGSYLEQLQDAVEILPSFAATSPAMDQQPAAPKMTTMPARATYPGSFAPTKPQNVKGISSHSVSQAGGYLEQMMTAVSGLASFAAMEAATPVEDDGTTFAAPKMSTVPMGRQTFHRDSFAPTQPSVKNMDGSSSMSSYLNEMGSAVAGLSSFVGTVEAAITTEPAPKMTTVPAKVSFAKGSFAPTKSNVKGLSSTTVAQAGGYLEQLQGAVAALSSYTSAAPLGEVAAMEDAVAAPKMTTVPMGNQQFGQDSFAPTKASIKDNTVVPAAMFSNYLNHLQGAMSGLSTFVNDVSQEVTGAPIAEEIRAPKMTTVPAQQTFAQGSFAPTKPSIKDISSTTLSQASNYLDQLKGAAEAISSFVDAVQPSAGPDATATAQNAAPKMTTVPMGNQVFRQDSFAPTQPSVKNLDASSMTGYLSQLGSAVHGLSSFVDVVKQVVPEATSDAGSIAPKMTTVPMSGQTFPRDSYAPTKKNIKGLSSVSVSQAGGYLEQLQGAMAGLASFSGNLPPPGVADDSIMAPKMTTVPMGKQTFHRDSFAPTRPTVKGVDAMAMTSYLDTIGEAAMGLSSFVAAVSQSVVEDPPAPKMTTVPMGRQTFSQNSFAPTKPGVKGVSSVSVSQAGGYLDHLKEAIEVLSSLSDARQDEGPPGTEPDVAPKMTTVPMGKQSFHRDSFAPTQPSVRNLDAHSMASYLDGLGHAVEGLSTFVEDVVQAVSSPDPPAPKMTTVPMGHQTFSQSSYAPTKPTVKGISSTSVSQAGFYLDHLKQAVQGISSVANVSPNVKSIDDRAAKAGAIASLVHDLRSTASQFSEYTADFDGLTGALETLGSAVDGMEQFVDEVKQSLTSPEPVAAVDQQTQSAAQTSTVRSPSMPFSSMPRASIFSNSFAPTKPNVKGLSGASIAQAGGYLDQLKGAIVELSSFSDVSPPVSDGVFAQENTVAAPKMTTVPMGNQSFGQSSFAPTKPSVKNISSQSLSAYLDGLGHAVEGLSTFVEAVHESTATPFSSMPKGTPFVSGSSFAPTKPTIKNISFTSVSQAGGYLEQLKNAVHNLHSVAAELPVETHAQVSLSNEEVAPRMTTVPMGKATFKQASFAPTKSNVKNVSSQTLSVYLDSLNHAVQGLSSFVKEVSEAVPEYDNTVRPTETFASVPFSSMPKAGSFAKGAFSPTKPSIKGSSSSTVAQAGGYLDHLHDAEVDIVSFPAQSQLHAPAAEDFMMAPKMTTVPMGKQTFPQSSFAPTKPNIKGLSSNTVTQDGGYLDHLHDGEAGITPFAEPNLASAQVTEDSFVAPKMTTVPMGKQTFHQSSFSPTKPSIKGMSSSVSLPSYLSGLNNAVAGLSSFIESVDKAVAFSSMPKPGAYAPGSYAPTKPGVKTVESSSVAQAGGYLDKLRSVVHELSSFAVVSQETHTPQDTNQDNYPVAPKMTTVPMGKASFKEDSFAPTKSSVKNVVPVSLPSYLDDLQDAVSGLSSFMNEVAETVSVTTDISPPRMTTMPAKVTTFQKGAFAPTKGSVKDKSGRSSGMQGNYLDALKVGLDSLRSQISQAAPVEAASTPPVEPAPKMSTVPAKQTNLQPGGYAPTKPSIKSVAPVTQAGGYLDNLKNAVSGLSSFVDAVSNAPIPTEAPVVEQLKASADRLTPFVEAETPASLTALEPVQIPTTVTGVTQPALDSAVSTLNQKLSSLSIVVSELSTANDARNEHLEAKVDDLTVTVQTLNQSVSNLASCIQSLNDGFKGLMSVAETLQQQQVQPVTRAAP